MTYHIQYPEGTLTQEQIERGKRQTELAKVLKEMNSHMSILVLNMEISIRNGLDIARRDRMEEAGKEFLDCFRWLMDQIPQTAKRIGKR